MEKILELKVRSKEGGALEYGYRTDKGRVRALNEDACAVAQKDSATQFGVVADGMGGHNAGEIAAQMTISFVAEAFSKEAVVSLKDIRGIVDEANARAYALAVSDAGCTGMGTTLVLAVCEESTVYVANIGDSRAYHYDAKRRILVRVSKDHSLVEELLSNGKLNAKQAEKFPFRNIITRALGTGQSVSADLFDVPWEKGDAIVLCSDGLTMHVSDEMLRRKLALGQSPQIICDDLIDMANLAGGHDNITVVVIRNEGGERA